MGLTSGLIAFVLFLGVGLPLAAAAVHLVLLDKVREASPGFVPWWGVAVVVIHLAALAVAVGGSEVVDRLGWLAVASFVLNVGASLVLGARLLGRPVLVSFATAAVVQFEEKDIMILAGTVARVDGAGPRGKRVVRLGMDGVLVVTVDQDHLAAAAPGAVLTPLRLCVSAEELVRVPELDRE